MWLQFILENSHFALNLLVALVVFAVFWLIFDAWLVRKNLVEFLKLSGFFLLSVSFLVHATSLDSSVLSNSLVSFNLNVDIVILTRVLGYLLIIVGQLLDPLQSKPLTSGITKNNLAPASLIGLKTTFGIALFPILSLGVCLAYLRRATLGLESHLKPVALSFLFITMSEILGLATLFRDSSNVGIFNLVKPFGPLWYSEHLLLLFGAMILGKWVLGYLLKRLQSQLFMIFNISILVIFLLTTVSFTFLLLRNLQTESLSELTTDVKVLNLSIESKKSESLSDAQLLAENSQVVTSVLLRDKNTLKSLTESFLLTKKENFLVIVDENAQVLARGEDSERIGDSLSADSLVRRALLGEKSSSVITKDGVLAPQVYVRAAAPVRKNGQVVGAALVGSVLDNAFVDGLKKATGLEVSIYGGNQLSATTQTTGGSRKIGIKIEDPKIKDNVLKKGKSFTGSINLLNVPFLVSYLPLKDIDNSVVGMTFVGRPEVGVIQTASRSIELTFLVTVILLALSIIPAYLISGSLAKQLK